MENYKLDEELSKFVDVKLTNKLLENGFLNKELKWMPYVGNNYSTNNERILIVGKSYYNWGSDDAKEQLNDYFFNLGAIIWNGLGFNRWKGLPIDNPKGKKFYRSLERIFFNTLDIYTENFNHKRKKLWSSISFHQLLQNPMLEGWYHKDTKKERIDSFNKLIEIIDVIKPDHILMMSNNYNYENAFKSVLKEFGFHYIEEEIIWKKSNGSDIRSIRFFKDDYSFRFSLLVHPSSSKSNYNEQNSLLSEIMPDFLKYLKE